MTLTGEPRTLSRIVLVAGFVLLCGMREGVTIRVSPGPSQQFGAAPWCCFRDARLGQGAPGEVTASPGVGEGQTR